MSKNEYNPNFIEQTINMLDNWYIGLGIIGQALITPDYRKVKADLVAMKVEHKDNDQEYKAITNYLSDSAQKGSLVSFNVMQALKGEGPIFLNIQMQEQQLDELISNLIMLSEMLKESIKPHSAFQSFAAQSNDSKKIKAFSEGLLRIVDKIPHQEWEPHPRYQLEEAIKSIKQHPECMKYFLEKNDDVRNLYQSHMPLLVKTYKEYQASTAKEAEKTLIFSRFQSVATKEEVINTKNTLLKTVKCH